jgi:molybdate transport system ATP-binding protein
MTIAVALAGQISRDFALDITFEGPVRGVTALLGPSGSGKTTVLRALAGLDRIAGSIRFGDEVWQDDRTFVPAHKRRVGYVFQGSGLLPHLSVRRNLAYAVRRAPPGPFVMEDLVARTGIGPLLDRMPERLSGGEAQRAAIARALMGQPRLLLMDEPLSALDSDARNGMVGYLERLFEDIAIPAIYVTHDRAEADRLADRTIMLRAGKIDIVPSTRAANLKSDPP